jgi:hypothetical protein
LTQETDKDGFNFQNTPNPPQKLFAAFIIKGTLDQIQKFKAAITQNPDLTLVYQHKDSRYMKVTLANPNDDF